MTKHLYQIVKLIVTCLLLTGCSSKEIFYFSKSTGSFGPYQKVQKTTNMPDSVAILSEPSQPEIIFNDAPELTASADHQVQAPLSQQEQVAVFNPFLPAPERKMHLNKKMVKNSQPLNFKTKKQLFHSKANKKVHELALIGFILSLGALPVLLAGSPLAFLLSIVGVIFSIIGLNKIKKKPDSFSGKGLAWVGIILGILLPLIVVGYILAFAGAFSGGN